VRFCNFSVVWVGFEAGWDLMWDTRIGYANLWGEKIFEKKTWQLMQEEFPGMEPKRDRKI
jgi:hypothetical protein